MENEMLMDDAPKNDRSNYNSWEISGDDTPGENTTTMEKNKKDNSKETPASAKQKQTNKNSAAKAVSHAQSAVGNTNPNIRTGLSDELSNTGTNVAYTERED